MNKQLTLSSTTASGSVVLDHAEMDIDKLIVSKPIPIELQLQWLSMLASIKAYLSGLNLKYYHRIAGKLVKLPLANTILLTINNIPPTEQTQFNIITKRKGTVSMYKPNKSKKVVTPCL